MPTLIIHGAEGRARRFHPAEGETLIGRGEEADLSLPNVSVSREHARLHVSGESVVIEDLSSRNGVRVGGERMEPGSRAPLQPGQEVRVGKFRLTLVAGGETFFQGRFIEYIPEYQPGVATTQAATHALSAAEALQLELDTRRIQDSRVVLASNRRRFWHPEDRALTFGGGGMVPVEGWFTGGVVAEIVWKDRQHILVKKGGFMVKVIANGAKVEEHTLQNGESFQVGGTSFVFECPTA